MDVGLVNLGVAEDLLDGVKSATEQILAKLFEMSTSERYRSRYPRKESRSQWKFEQQRKGCAWHARKQYVDGEENGGLKKDL
jgi:hypothetical protein